MQGSQDKDALHGKLRNRKRYENIPIFTKTTNWRQKIFCEWYARQCNIKKKMYFKIIWSDECLV